MIIDKTGELMNASELIIGVLVSYKSSLTHGFAFQVGTIYPNVKEAVDAACLTFGEKNFGNCLCLVSDDKDYVIAALFGLDGSYQDGFSTDYDALEHSLKILHDIAVFNGNDVALPYGLGCGVGGAEWSQVRTMIDEIFKDYQVTIYREPTDEEL